MLSVTPKIPIPNSTVFSNFLSKVKFGSSIGEVTDELIHDVNDELSEAYPKCQVMTYAPSDEMYGLEVLTNESFDYEMQGIVVDKSKPVNTIIYFGVKEMDE